jgi:hypothetical protein
MSKTTELRDINADPESLNRLSLAELRALWQQSCPKVTPTLHRCLLVRDLALVAQSGGTRLPRETEALVKAAMKAASVTRSQDEQPSRRARLPSPKAVQGMPAGAVLVREWGGHDHRVTVLGAGLFEYQNQTYKSLTQVAKVITGAHWSGPCFFGLNKFRRKA